MGTEPLENEIPIEISDFPEDIQLALLIYSYLQDTWDTMSGTYLGKSMGGILDIFEILEINKNDRKNYIDFIKMIDDARATVIAESKPKTKAPST